MGVEIVESLCKCCLLYYVNDLIFFFSYSTLLLTKSVTSTVTSLVCGMLFLPPHKENMYNTNVKYVSEGGPLPKSRRGHRVLGKHFSQSSFGPRVSEFEGYPLIC